MPATTKQALKGKKAQETTKDKKVQETTKQVSKDKKVPETTKQVPKNKKVPETTKQAPKDKKVPEPTKQVSKDKKVPETTKQVLKNKKVPETTKQAPKDKKVPEPTNQVSKDKKVSETIKDKTPETTNQVSKDKKVPETKNQVSKDKKVPEPTKKVLKTKKRARKATDPVERKEASDTDSTLLDATSIEDESDYSQDESNETNPLPVPKIPKLVHPKPSKTTQKGGAQESRVVYLGRIPHGFYEPQIRGYFSQFGTILNLRLSRNKRTGKSKHYAFIEFEELDVAKIAAETMHNYLLYNRLLKCSIMPSIQLHPKLFKAANKNFKPVNFMKINAAHHNSPKSLKPQTTINNAAKRARRSESKRNLKLVAAGIDYSL
ncbi:hypothetical protein BB561_005132 [Smittium simulii]|uniref:RRM domain-containing protein n=1 Tax=Smittium simulii TaxID=133385 RepID=A0A2T9YC14_9FUNG|nr:hypothetical protein BB561_005132 [Smittium simulii]